MKQETRTYAEFFYPGSFVAETSEVQVPDRGIPADVPRGAYGVRFFDRVVVTTTAGDREVETRSERLDISGVSYFDARVMTLADVEREMPGERILLDNMRCNRWDRVVRTNRGWMQPFRDGDSVVATTVEP